MLRPGSVGMRGSMVIRLQPCMRSSTSLLSSTPPLPSTSPPTTVSWPLSVSRSTTFPDIGPYEAGAESSPFSIKNTRKASSGHLGNVNRTSSPLANTSSATESARPCNCNQANRAYPRIHVGAARRELARDKGARFLPPRYSCIDQQTWTHRFSSTILPIGAHSWYKGQDHLWWLGNISAHTSTPGQYMIGFLDQPSSRYLPIGILRLLEPFTGRDFCMYTKEAI